MMKNQPSQLVSASVTNTRTSGTGVRTFAAEVVLIRNWLETIRHCATVIAHSTRGGQLPECEELLELLEGIEAAIRSDIPDGAALLDRLAEWEASLLHLAPEVPASQCLTCQRAKSIPDSMPAECAWAMRVIDDAA